MRNKKTPPRWCSHAIPTIYGWADPKTGELLISQKGLENPVPGYRYNRPWKAPIPNALKEIMEEHIDEVIEEVLEEEAVDPEEIQPEIDDLKEVIIEEFVASAIPKEEIEEDIEHVINELAKEVMEIKPEPVAKPKRKRGRPRKKKTEE